MRKGKLGILCVTYKQPFMETELYLSLVHSTYIKDLIIFNYFNGSKFDRIIETDSFTEEETTKNGGLALGYNKGIDYCRDKVDSIIFFNSDCSVTDDIFEAYFNNLKEKNHDVFVPTLICRNRVISPFKKSGFNFDFYIISWMQLYIKCLEGYKFSDKFWLDGIDYELSEWINLKNLKVKIFEKTCQHDLSILSNYQGTPNWRILNIYTSEKNFLKANYRFGLFKGILRALVNKRFGLAKQLLRLW
jgi:hypothetical protein